MSRATPRSGCTARSASPQWGRGVKATLRRLAAKQGWYDGRDGRDQVPPSNLVVLPGANRYGRNPVPLDEEQAYWTGYDEGREAERGALNPYALTD